MRHTYECPALSLRCVARVNVCDMCLRVARVNACGMRLCVPALSLRCVARVTVGGPATLWHYDM